jgi:hypothetical protein
VYVGYRTPTPDNATQEAVQTILQQKYIDGSQLVDNPTEHCQEVENFANDLYPPSVPLPELNLQANTSIVG